MTGQLETAHELATLMERHTDEIAADWAEKVHNLSDSRYCQVPLAELTATASRGIAAIIDGLKTGSHRAVEEYLTDVTLTRLEAGFDFSDVLEALLMLREAALPIVWRTYSSDWTMATFADAQLDATIRHAAGRFGDLYAIGVEQYLQKQQAHESLLLETNESLRRVTKALLQKLSTLDEVLKLVCREACKLTGADGSAMLLLEDDGWLRVASSCGTPLPALERLPIRETFAGSVLEQGQPLLLNSPEKQVQAYLRNPNLKTLLAIPLFVDETIIGVLDVVNKLGGFTQEDTRIMGLFADQAAIAIENAQLHGRAEHLAIVEERQRLARELHDSVTQTLYSVNLYAGAAQMALASGKTEVAAENLRELRHMAREALLDMRMLIFELHPPILKQEGLAGALQARLEAVEARSGLQTEFQIGGEERLPLSVEENLYRIAQESLANAVRHARAQKVTVRLYTDSGRFYMEVQDDGAGFDLAKAERSGGLGLRSIRERVRRINGELTIESVPGKGTTLRVEVET